MNSDRSTNFISTMLAACALFALAAAAELHAGPIHAGDATDKLIQQFTGRIHAELADELQELPEFRKAVAEFQQGRFDACLKLLEQARGKHQGMPPARLTLARLLISSRQTQQARILLERVAADEPTYPGTYLSFARLAVGEGRWNDAMLNLRHAETLAQPKSWKAEQRTYFRIQCTAGLATVAERRGQWSNAERHLRVWLVVSPDDNEARERLARALFAQQKEKTALKELRALKLKKSDSPSIPAALKMARLSEWMEASSRTGSTEKTKYARKAEKWMRAAIKEAPKQPLPYRELAGWLLEHHRPDESSRYAEKAAELDSESHVTRLLQAQIARTLKQPDVAVRFLEPLLKKNPADFESSNLLALALIALKDDTQSQRALQLAVVNARQYPRSAAALSTLGWISYRLDHKTDSARLLDEAVRLGPVTADVAYFHARNLNEKTNRDQIIRLLQTALNTTGVFVYRTEATDWLARLRKRPNKDD